MRVSIVRVVLVSDLEMRVDVSVDVFASDHDLYVWVDVLFSNFDVCIDT